MKNLIVTSVVAMVGTLGVCAENITVRGVIKDSRTREAIIGASVVEQGTNYVIITDINGEYVIYVPVDACLSVIYVCSITSLITVGCNNTLVVLLDENTIYLNKLSI